MGNVIVDDLLVKLDRKDPAARFRFYHRLLLEEYECGYHIGPDCPLCDGYGNMGYGWKRWIPSFIRTNQLLKRFLWNRIREVHDPNE